MKTFPAVLSFTTALLCAGAAAVASPSLQIDLAAPGKAISRDLVGVFFEDLNYAADGGLYAELIQNRSFEYSPTEQGDWGPLYGWELVQNAGGDGQLGLGDPRPVHPNNPHYLLLTVLEPGAGVGIANKGFDQLPVEAGNDYEASFWGYQAYMGRMWKEGDQSKPMPVTLQLQAKDGEILAEARLEVSGRAWTQHRATLTPRRSDPEARFVLLAHAQGGLALDMVSLFPKDTFKGRANGLRRDLAQTIADIRPRFMRFPGGCLVHGSGVHRYYLWKACGGPVAQRGELDIEEVFVPARVLRDLVVGNDICALLRRGPPPRDHARYVLEAELLRGQDAAVPGDDATFRVDKDGHRPAELTDRLCDLFDLRVGMRAGVVRVGHQVCDGAPLDRVGRPRRGLRAPWPRRGGSLRRPLRRLRRPLRCWGFIAGLSRYCHRLISSARSRAPRRRS